MDTLKKTRCGGEMTKIIATCEGCGKQLPIEVSEKGENLTITLIKRCLCGASGWKVGYIYTR